MFINGDSFNCILINGQESEVINAGQFFVLDASKGLKVFGSWSWFIPVIRHPHVIFQYQDLMWSCSQTVQWGTSSLCNILYLRLDQKRRKWKKHLVDEKPTRAGKYLVFKAPKGKILMSYIFNNVTKRMEKFLWQKNKQYLISRQKIKLGSFGRYKLWRQAFGCRFKVY